MPKRRFFFVLLVSILTLFLLLWSLFFFSAPQPSHVTWGVNFSKEYASYLGLDWKQVYLAILDDLEARDLKLFNQWNAIESQKDHFAFTDTDWQIAQATKRQARIIYVMGMKSGRWPECHVPSWAEHLSQEEQQRHILEYLAATVNRYKKNPSIIAWQVENEPLFKFGVCPWYDASFLKQEVALVKSLDPTRPVIISDTGEQSLWITAGSIGDIVGTTLYRNVWAHINDHYGLYVEMPIPPVTYWLRAQLIEKLFHKKVINIELQAEPWLPKGFHNTPFAEQAKTMDLEQFKKTVAYAQETGLDTFYFWGVEWWYWMKEIQNQPDIWNHAKTIITQNL